MLLMLSWAGSTMHRPPPLKSVPLYPVTAFAGGAALAVTVLWWSGRNIDRLLMDGNVWRHWELWRALTSTLPHVNLVHLAFNLYWLWALGTTVERVYGHLRFAAVLLVLAAGSSLAEFALLQGGVGLSGVGYGLWALLWVLDRHDPRFAGAMDRQTSQVFILWFFVCIGLTVSDVMPVGNIAHGVGAVLGALLGFAAAGTSAARWWSSLAVVAILGLGLAGSTKFWPGVNLSSYGESEVERAGVEALERLDNTNAVKYLEASARMRKAPARAWFNLGVGYQRLGQYPQALMAYQQAASMPGADPAMRQAAEDMQRYLTAREPLQNRPRP